MTGDDTSSAMNMAYCVELSRKADPDRFMLAMGTPGAARRGAVCALLAFNHEIAKTREVVSEQTLGLIRLQWWRDEIAKLYKEEGGAPASEVLAALGETIKRYELPQSAFEALCYAREFDLEDVLPGDMDGLTNYADFTLSPLLRLILRVCGEEAGEEAIRQTAVNYALVGLMRSLPVHAAQRRCYVPETVLDNYELGRDDLILSARREDAKNAVLAVLSSCEKVGQSQSRFLNRMQLMAELYRRRIVKLGGDVWNPRMAAPPAFLPLRVLLQK